MHKLIPALFGAFLSVALAGSAQALNTRTWVSGKGIDQAGCGPIASPCRTLQFAHDQTSAAGEVDILDSAGYGSLTITKAISIVADGVLAGVTAGSGAEAIAINAGTGSSILLRGLTIEGASVADNGIIFNSGSELTVSHCLVEYFNGAGIRIQHSAGAPKIVIDNTTASSNTAGISYTPIGAGGGTLSIDHAATNTQEYGIWVNMQNSSGRVLARVSNTVSYGNVYGIYATTQTGNLAIKIDTSALSGSSLGFSNAGISYLGRTAITGNSSYGIFNVGTIYSYGNNEIDENGTDIFGNALISKTLQ